MLLINYSYLHQSEVFYALKGFNRIEAPWWVPESIANITKPKEVPDSANYLLSKNNKCLVASGEQSFLYLANQGLLLPGLYQTITPCFRDEVQGPMKRKFFMKNELIIVDPDKLKEKHSVEGIINTCLDFFKTVVPDPALLKVVTTDIGYDIEYNGVEIGSYGERKTSFIKWIYATGCAEPRLSWSIAIAEGSQVDEVP